MNEYGLISPEKIKLNIELAGLGSRFAALLIDWIFRIILLTFFGIIFVIIVSIADYNIFYFHEYDNLQNEIVAVFLLLVVGIAYGYSVVFEAIWNGQTPGKRFLKIRVVHKDGSPVTFSQVLARNMLAILDSLPVFYGIGIISILVTKRNQRLGDLAAGTIVSREKDDYAPAILVLELPEAAWADAARPHLSEITEDEFSVLKQYLLRQKKIRTWEALQMERKLAEHFSHKLGVKQEDIPNLDIFLKQVAQLYQTNTNLRLKASKLV